MPIHGCGVHGSSRNWGRSRWPLISGLLLLTCAATATASGPGRGSARGLRRRCCRAGGGPRTGSSPPWSSMGGTVAELVYGWHASLLVGLVLRSTAVRGSRAGSCPPSALRVPLAVNPRRSWSAPRSWTAWCSIEDWLLPAGPCRAGPDHAGPAPSRPSRPSASSARMAGRARSTCHRSSGHDQGPHRAGGVTGRPGPFGCIGRRAQRRSTRTYHRAAGVRRTLLELLVSSLPRPDDPRFGAA